MNGDSWQNINCWFVFMNVYGQPFMHKFIAELVSIWLESIDVVVVVFKGIDSVWIETTVVVIIFGFFKPIQQHE